MKNRIPIFLICAGVVVLALGVIIAFRLTSGATNTSSAEYGAKSQGVLHIPVPDSILEMNPRVQVSSNLKAISNAIFSRLLRVNNAGEVEPDLASSWSFDFTKREVIMNIRPDVYFHDNTQLTSEDVAYSFGLWLAKGGLDNNRLFDIEGAESYASGKSASLPGIRVVDKTTIAIKLKKAFTEDFIYALSTPRFYIFKKPRETETSSSKNENSVGTGPFKLKSMEKNRVVLERFDRYYSKAAKVKELHFYFRDLDSAIGDLIAGKADALFAYSDLPKEKLESKNFKVVPLKKTTTIVLFFMNQGNGRSLKFRKGVRSIFSVSDIQKTCFPDDTIAQNVIPSGLRGSSLSTRIKPQEDATYSAPANTPILFSTAIESTCLRKNLSETLRKYGSDFREFPNLEELYQYFLAGKVDFAMELLTFHSLDPSSVLQYFNPSSNEYFLRVPVPELQQMFQEVANAETALARARIFERIDNFLVDQAFVIPIIHQSFYTAYSPALSGFSASDFGNILNVKWEELGLGAAQ